MRHRRLGRKLGRIPSHQRALLRSLASNLILTERADERYSDPDLDDNIPKVKGRIITTIQKAKEVRPLVERCISLACRVLPQLQEAAKLESGAERNSDAWKAWRTGDGWKKWNAAIAPVVAARRRALVMLGSKEAVQLLFSTVAPRFTERPGGYTRVLRLAKPRLGDNGTRAILEFVGQNDRKRRKAPKPSFESEAAAPALPAPEAQAPQESPAAETTSETAAS